MDPLSLATGSAGLVSLGITICDGLLTYCRSYKSRDDDLNALGDNSGRLQNYLRVIEKRLQSGPVADASFHATVLECLSACKCCVHQVQVLNDKYSQLTIVPGSSLKIRSKAVLRKFQYPFEADRFETLRKQLNDFHSALSGLLLVMNYDLTNELRHNVTLHSAALVSAVSSQGSELSLQMASMGSSITHALDEGLTRVDSSIEKHFSALEEQWSIIRKSRNTPQSAPDEILARKVITPATLETLALFDSLCSCSKNYRGNHERGCFRLFQHKTVHTIAKEFRVFNLLLCFRLEVERAPHAFVRDFKVHPNFSVRGRVAWPSEAFLLTYKTVLKMERGLAACELRKNFRDCLVKLQILFEEGKAWPTDVSRTGKTLLHIACIGTRMYFDDDTAALYLQFLRELINLGVPLNDISNDWQETPLAVMIKQSRFWTMSFCPGSRSPSLTSHTPHGSPSYDNIARHLIDFGAELPGIEEPRVVGLEGPYFLPMLHRRSIAPEEDFGYGPLSRELIQQSEMGVRQLLSKSASHILEKSRNLESPLHAAIPWPKGVELLLLLGGDAVPTLIDAPNAFGESPLEYALQLSQLSSVRLLLHANAEIDLETMLNIETSRMRGWSMAQSDEVIEFLCQTLADRRKRMLCLALELLPDHEIDRLKLKGQNMLQDNAFEVSESLRYHGHHSLPWFGNVRRGSMFYSACLSRVLAQALLREGFQSPTETFNGFTPLMTVDLYYLTYRRYLEGTVDLVTWFLDHGADLHSPIPVSGLKGAVTQSTGRTSSFKAIHRIADAYGEGLNRCYIDAEEDSRVGHMRGVINDTSTDPCRCYCSHAGCTPATIFIRSLWHRDARTDEFTILGHHDVLNRGVELLSLLLSSLNERGSDVAADIIRVSTFQRLGMKHTCCKYLLLGLKAPKSGICHAILTGEYKVVDIMDPEEVTEIQEEDQHLALRLNALVAEFAAMYNEQGVSFHDFFFGYWWKRMDEVEAEKDEVCADDLGGFREIGIILDGEE